MSSTTLAAENLRGQTRFVARREHFGVLVFDREGTEPIVFRFDGERERYLSFAHNCRRRGLITELDNRTLPNALSAPIKLSFNITSRCNLQCTHCYANSSPQREQGLPYEQVCRLFDEMAQLGILSVSIKGGEPFVYPDILPALEYAQQVGIGVTLISNGTLINDEIAQMLRGTSVTYVSISFDGADADVHETVRGRGTFSRAVRGFEALKRHFGRPVYFNYTLNRRNVHQLAAAFALAKNLGSDGLRFRPTLPGGRAAAHPDLVVPGELYRAALEQILALSEAHGIDAEVFGTDVAGRGCEENDELFSGFGCPAGNTYAHIDALGNFYPCEYLEIPELGAGNILTTSLKELWDRAEVFHSFRNLAGNDTCSSCSRFSSCKGGCRARVILGGADVNEPDPWCAEWSPESERRILGAALTRGSDHLVQLGVRLGGHLKTGHRSTSQNRP